MHYVRLRNQQQQQQPQPGSASVAVAAVPDEVVAVEVEQASEAEALSPDEVLLQTMLSLNNETEKPNEKGPASSGVDNKASVAPIAARARAELEKINVYTSIDVFSERLLQKLGSGRALFLIEAPSSKPRVCSFYIELLAPLARLASFIISNTELHCFFKHFVAL